MASYFYCMSCRTHNGEIRMGCTSNLILELKNARKYRPSFDYLFVFESEKYPVEDIEKHMLAMTITRKYYTSTINNKCRHGVDYDDIRKLMNEYITLKKINGKFIDAKNINDEANKITIWGDDGKTVDRDGEYKIFKNLSETTKYKLEFNKFRCDKK